jgi:hypothetical protein
MGSMSTTREIVLFDWVELTAAIDDAPKGSRGGVLEFHDGDLAMVEIMEPSLGPAERIVFAPLDSLRLIDPPAERR